MAGWFGYDVRLHLYLVHFASSQTIHYPHCTRTQCSLLYVTDSHNGLRVINRRLVHYGARSCPNRHVRHIEIRTFRRKSRGAKMESWQTSLKSNTYKAGPGGKHIKAYTVTSQNSAAQAREAKLKILVAAIVPFLSWQRPGTRCRGIPEFRLA